MEHLCSIRPRRTRRSVLQPPDAGPTTATRVLVNGRADSSAGGAEERRARHTMSVLARARAGRGEHQELSCSYAERSVASLVRPRLRYALSTAQGASDVGAGHLDARARARGGRVLVHAHKHKSQVAPWRTLVQAIASPPDAPEKTRQGVSGKGRSNSRAGESQVAEDRSSTLNLAPDAPPGLAEETVCSDLPADAIGRASFLELLLDREQKKAAEKQAQQTGKEPVLLCPGAGIFFFWQVGAVQYLIDNYEGVDKMRMTGASAGALVAALVAGGVFPETMILEAYRLGLRFGIWERPLGLLGVWGSLVRQWLMDLLPDNIAERCQGRVAIIVTKLPGLEVEGYDTFRSKADLVDAVMASVHVPFFLDYKAWVDYRGVACMDGSLIEFLSNGAVASYEPFFDGRRQVGFDLDYFRDEELQWTRADFLKLRSFEEVLALYAKGYAFARRMDEQQRSKAFASMTRRAVPRASGPDVDGLIAKGELVRQEVLAEQAAALEAAGKRDENAEGGRGASGSP